MVKEGCEILGLLRMIHLRIEKYVQEILDAFGLTYAQGEVLMQLYQHEKLSVGAMAKNLNLTYPNCSLILQRLEKAGFVLRIPSVTDRRVMCYSATDKALTMRDEVVQAFEKARERFFENMSQEELVGLRDGLAQFNKNLDTIQKVL